MATQVTLPELGEGIESGDVLEIFVSVGDMIKKGQDIVEMETDKATVPVPSSAAGKVTKINISQGQSVPVGTVLIEVEASESAPQSENKPAPPPAKAESAKPQPEPAAPLPVAEAKPEPPKPQAAAAQPAAPQPVASKPAAPQRPQHEPAEPVAATPPHPALLSTASSSIPAGPAIRRFAREVGVDLSTVTGSGEDGRITRDDVLAVVRQANSAVRSSAASSSSSTAPASSGAAASANPLAGTADTDDYGPIRVERMSKIRKTISAQMHLSWSSVPRVTNFDDADITNLELLRQSSKDDYAAQGLKLTTMPFLIKAVATALKHHPLVNAVIDPENEQIIYKEYVNVGVAVDTDRGLVVPVLKNADRMGVPGLTRGLAEMAGKVRGGQFAVSDLRGGTFTISNLGAIGGQYSTPIVNIPEVAILLVGRSRKLPVVMPDDSIKPRLMMPLSLSYDHRLVDGAAAARFLNDVIGYLEAPSRLLLAL